MSSAGNFPTTPFPTEELVRKHNGGREIFASQPLASKPLEVTQTSIVTDSTPKSKTFERETIF